MEPFWPRRSPHFLACRRAVRPFLAPGEVVVGLSGGADSLALVAAARAEGQEVHAVIVDHQLQPGSDAVAERAARQARRLGARATVARVTVPAGNLEANARTARYAALREHGTTVWVAHTRDDQAETLLLQALRGNPGGMAPEQDGIVRPFLTVRRRDTEGACAELQLDPWHDPHNDNPDFQRVAVRTALEQIHGDPVEPLAQTAERIAADNALLTELAGPPTDDCAELAAQPGPLRRRRIAAWLIERDIRPTRASISMIEDMCTTWHGQGAVKVGGRLEVRRVGGRLALSEEA
ncbi:tRNA(Ile)-lysidine synthase [Corynebacterium pollutisoli]|uniref:tRNA(Ile)-lysidine synthase n=1 Tax=Corynebacterium pollutisoli TaxID=1610489 RepID=A0A1X7J3C4_9CORY|nr:tRNA lysidine(34) synthetase TilS [Corynebacterium pollutisoli]SMG21987.1 tRNA(Ile)-lysidine synthase [Corynebacterium pollutisoli]